VGGSDASRATAIQQQEKTMVEPGGLRSATRPPMVAGHAGHAKEPSTTGACGSVSSNERCFAKSRHI
jgi:hypothetical protein